MDRSLLAMLVDPLSKRELQLEAAEYSADGDIVAGTLCTPGGKRYTIVDGIPRIVQSGDPAQQQTAESFGFKWHQQHAYGSATMTASAQEWLVQRYGFTSPADMRRFFDERKCVLDAGCGSGFSASLWLDPAWNGGQWIGADISTAIDVAKERLGSIPKTHFIQADVMQLPFREGTFDTIFSEGVLHHTPSTERALKALVPLLESAGEILVYVYRKKAPIREFTDDYVRDLVSSLPAEEAWQALEPLTSLAKALASLHATVDVTEDVPLLGIKAGRYDVQRLIYWHFAKLFWNDRFTFEENQNVNFDWYHPRYAHRQTEDDVRRWCAECQLSITHFDVQESGFTIRAVKE